MKRILFVDDDPRLLDGLRRALRRRRLEWEMAFATSGDEALAILDADRFDILVSDMRMPGMDGAELLARARDRHPGVVRLILSGQSSRDAVLRAANLTHQFLPKPIDADVLERVLARALALQDLLRDDALRSVVSELDALPSLPDTYAALTRCVSDDDATVQRITAILSRDTGMCAKVLQIANSAFFGLARQTASLETAVTYLGLNVLKSLALSTGVFRDAGNAAPVQGFSLAAEQDHAIAVACVARAVAGSEGNRDTAVAAGILHDVGKLVLSVGRPRALEEVLRTARHDSRPAHLVEGEILAVDHAAIGAYLLGIWGLPQEIVEAIAFHHAPSAAPHPAFDTIAVIHVADALVREREAELAGRSDADASALLDRAYIASIGVRERLPAWREAAAAALGD
jgi:putative nucleotidyltransferase with HDIG domain